MPWDPDEKFWRDKAWEGYDPAKSGPEYQMWAKRAEGLDMAADSRGCEKEPARCSRCGGALRFEFVITRVGPLTFGPAIVTPWPVAVCAANPKHREEL